MRHLLEIADLSSQEAGMLLEEAGAMKAAWRQNPAAQQHRLPHATLAMLFEKPSLRTRVSFEVAMRQLGGHAIYLAPSDVLMNERETAPDIAKVLSRYCQGIMARVFSHQTLTDLAGNASVPVINGLSDAEHPCQALADLLTLQEIRGLKDQHLVYLGDGNNVCHSLIQLCVRLGVSITVACPRGYEPSPGVVKAGRTLGKVEVMHDPIAAVSDADVLYTDVWTSMGQEEQSEKRRGVFPPFQINSDLLRAAPPHAIVMHCLPAHRGEEISAEVLDGPQSVVYQQAENRLHAQKAVLCWLLEKVS